MRISNRTRHAISARDAVAQPRVHKVVVAKHGEHVKVSNVDYTTLSRQPWYLRHGYAYCTRLGLMHRAVLALKLGRPLAPGELVDHINRDPTDNRRENLRLATFSENAVNAGLRRKNTSGYKGVSRMSGRSKYRAMINVAGQSISLGCYSDAEEAAYIYDQFTLAIHGPHAYFNLLEP